MLKMNKQTLRKWAKDKRKELNITEIRVLLVNKLIQTNEYKVAKNIMIYYPLKDEVNLLSLLDDKTKQFYLPRINDEELECCPYTTGDKLCESCFHTLEPVCLPCNKSLIDLVIVPALACDEQGYRLGYGGGFYDRFLKNFNGTKVVCVPKELIIKTINPEKHDIKMDLILCS